MNEYSYEKIKSQKKETLRELLQIIMFLREEYGKELGCDIMSYACRNMADYLEGRMTKTRFRRLLGLDSTVTTSIAKKAGVDTQSMKTMIVEKPWESHTGVK